MAAAEERVDLTTVSDDELHKRLEDKTRQARRLLDTLLEDNPGLEDEYCLKPEVIKNCEVRGARTAAAAGHSHPKCG